MVATDTTGSSDISLTVLMIVNNQERSRDFYHNVLGAEIVRNRDPVILRFHHGIIVLNAGGGPTGDKPAAGLPGGRAAGQHAGDPGVG
jgi:catechol 2,3-dioxygenase-like lactoylglutathione lyase family enzyme